jgi:hypothetical protein
MHASALTYWVNEILTIGSGKKNFIILKQYSLLENLR